MSIVALQASPLKAPGLKSSGFTAATAADLPPLIEGLLYTVDSLSLYLVIASNYHVVHLYDSIGFQDAV